MRYVGELAALGTAACWSGGTNLFAAAGRRMGSPALNRLRLAMATLFLGATLLVTHGSPWPGWATGFQIAVLAASGVVGFIFGDANYFRALVILGPGRASLLASLAPLFTVALAWPLLGERPGPLALVGVTLTVGGVIWVLRQRQGDQPVSVEGSIAVGILVGVLGAVGQAGGYILSKVALQTGLDALSATVIRVAAACLGIWILAAFQGALVSTWAVLRDRKAAAFMVGGAFLGPFLGVTLSLVALQTIDTGVAAALTAIFPIPTILLSARFHNERLTWQTLAGSLVAVAGVVVLFLR